MKQILSIQSSVTLGFVGNSVAAPVLTAMGHHPLAVDTIALAAHPGYGSRSGGVPANDDFTEILGALSLFDALGGISPGVNFQRLIQVTDPITSVSVTWMILKLQ